MNEEQKIVQYLRDNNHRSPIIEVYGNYVILAQDHQDLSSKESRISRGDCLGFYRKDLLLQTIKKIENGLQ